ncbi:MAG TPA: RIO1 family regulatory kinase/ATPase, partial [Actinophytocola sp.]|nr:RIO1 family regulatory kinase/ATPase [Actinophytocola sp.]
YPVQRSGTELLMEFLGDDEGSASPRLAELRPEPDELVELWHQLVAALEILASQGLTHGDLSAYNLLVHNGQIVLIDLPQIVDVVANPRGPEFLSRDVMNVMGWFRSRGLPDRLTDPEELTADLLTAAGLD